MEKNRFTTYLLYAVGEIVLVVIGILIAVNINNWNVAQKNRASEIQYLINIKSDLQIDLDNLAMLIDVRRQKHKSTQNIIRIMNGGHINSLDTLILHINHAMGERKFKPNNTTFMELSSSGNLNLISNDSIRMLLLDLTKDYAWNMEMMEHETFDYREYISRSTAAYFDMNKYLPIALGEQTAAELGVRESDFNELLNSLEYKNGVHIISDMSEYYIPLFQEMISKSERIIQHIDIELKKE